MVGRTLTADADVLALGAAGADRHREERLHGVVAFIERGGNETGVAVEAERELRHVVRTDREAVEVFEELVGKKRIARDFAHHVEAKAVHAALEAVAFHDFRHAAGFINRTHERNHEFDVREAHFIAHELHRAAFHREAFGKLVGDVARGAAEAEHRIFFNRFVVGAADELAVFVALEVGETNDDLLRIEGGGNGRHAFGDLAFVEGLGGGIARGEAFNGVAEFARNVRVLEHDLRMDADVVVDDELSKDSFMSEIYKASAPNGIIVEILSIDDFMKNTGTHKYSNKRLLILLKNIETVYELYLRQFKMEHIQLGGLPSGVGKKAIYKAIFLNEEEINKLRDIANSGVYIDMQVIPEDTKSDLMKMIK